MQSKDRAIQFFRKNDRTSKSMENLVQNKFHDFEFLSTSLEKFHNANKSSFFGDRLKSVSESSIDVCYIYDSDPFKFSESSSKSSENDLVKNRNFNCDFSKPDLVKNRNFNCDFSKPKEGEKCMFDDSGIENANDRFSMLENKIDKLYEIVHQQGETLSSLELESLAATDAVLQVVETYLKQAFSTINDTLIHKCMSGCPDLIEQSKVAGAAAASSVKSGSKALLDALEAQRQTAIIDESIKSTLTNFLQSDELRESLVTATTASLKNVVEQLLYQFEISTYRPLLRRSQRQLSAQLLTTLEDSFRTAFNYHISHYSMVSYKSSKMMRSALERHQRLLETTVARMRDPRCDPAVRNSFTWILKNELKQWRELFGSSLKDKVTVSPVSDIPLDVVPISPAQPTEPGKSAIEQLMSAAEINNKMREGNVNGSFERALSASDLSLVMAACRAADPDDIFEPPCRLQQNVLLSLLQQLATDMVHETQLKCRYLEDALTNLNTNEPTTAKHLPSVLTEASNNLSTFLRNYPSHVCARQIRMFVLAASSLLKESQEKLAKQSIANFSKSSIASQSKMKIRHIYES